MSVSTKQKLDRLQKVAKYFPFKFWVSELGHPAERYTHGVTKHGFQVIVERWAGLRNEVVPFSDAYPTERDAEAAERSE